MRRVAMLLGTVGVIALGLAATPVQAQAQYGWSGYSDAQRYPWSDAQRYAWRRHQWLEWARQNHGWREYHRWYPYASGDYYR